MALIKCKECGKEISDMAKNCPNCGCPVTKENSATDFSYGNQEQQYGNIGSNALVKKKESVCGIIGLILSFVSCNWLIGIVSVVLCLIGVFSKKKKSTCGTIGLVLTVIMILIGILAPQYMKYVDKAREDNADKNNTSITDSQVEDEEAAKDNLLSVGETYEKNGLKVTLNEYNDNYTEYSEYEEPKEGFKYVEASFTYENTDDSEKYVSIYDCDCYADNALCDQSYIGNDDFINANISKGRNVSFKVYYEVPVDASSIELEYNSNSFWSTDSDVVFKLK